MTVPPLFDHLDTEDEDQLRRDAALQESGLEADTEHQATRAHPRGMRERAQAWLHVEPFYWTMRVVYVCLAAGAIFAVYINGVAEGWWRAWGEKPSVAATTPATQPAPTASPSASGEAAMSGGYQIGPDGVLVRPAQFAADTYTKPELPEEAKENTERGAEAAAEHYLALMVYAWNTGDTRPLVDMSDSDSKFAHEVTQRISDIYGDGWVFNNSSVVEHVLKLEPTELAGDENVPGTVTVVLAINSSDGTICQNKNIYVHDQQYHSIFALVMTWNNDQWVVTQAGMEKTNA
ncbi:DUF6318 family protein [Pauljensenia sp. 20925_1_27]